MKKPLPTIDTRGTSISDFLKAIEDAFSVTTYSTVRMYFYGVTLSGWVMIRKKVCAWLKKNPSRKIIAYVGTDHALTDPSALEKMRADGITIYLLTDYTGTYHPKLFIFEGRSDVLILSGSNNLTGYGLISNVEFATSIKLPKLDSSVKKWEAEIHRSSSVLTSSLLSSYKRQRDDRQKNLENAKVSWQFTWKERKKARRVAGKKTATIKSPIALEGKTLIYEIMPRETGTDGSQIQILKPVAIKFFGIPDRMGSTITIWLKNVETEESRSLSMTYNNNTTFRLSIHEASFTARPCFVVFRRTKAKRFDFAVISESENPALYGQIDSRLPSRGDGARRYEIVK
jgi:hypothetical protein